MKPTIVLVHGAFAESASWNSVIQRLHADGYPVVAAPNPLRSLSGDAAVISSVVATIGGPVVLVGHSYGGAVISNAAVGHDHVKALVFVAAFAPEAGESIGELSGKFPGGTLGETLQEVPLPDGTVDLYIQQDKFHHQFTADVPPERAAVDAAAQRPLNTTALNEGSGEPAWKTVPSWFVYPELDYNIPLEAHRFMAERAGARASVELPGASHAIPASEPTAVAEIILKAATSTGWAG
ncbi:alpha/beta hydrolase [Micromonospora sp. NPDC047707]|uniref:alpha/beta fold hydrolase n=1 Tax=unclassified Micromonospora TaxID=2617518 RepID=UPI0012B46E08|nr:alpha/beta hydrolase [Micromonospora sp. WMMC415]QGN48077.1 alpha/beta fold hydrolase [Micromonospora sp. WMMC415]